MTRPVCFFCHKELHYIRDHRMMCYNKACEKVYAMDYECAPCSGKKRAQVLMEVVEPGKVCCPLCGDRQEAPGLNPETMMRSATISRLGERNREKRGQGPLGPVSFRASALRSIPQKKRPRPAEGDFFSSTEQGVVGRKNHAPLYHKFLAFPERAELCVEETDNGLTIVVEFPRHTIEQIQRRKEGTNLIIESAIAACPYRDEITLPDWATETADAKLLNGVLTIKFTK